MANSLATKAALPLGRVAQGWLASVGAWRHYCPDAAGKSALRRVYAEHHAQIPWADDAVRDVWRALDEAGLLTEFEQWRKKHLGYAAGWPTREAAERRRRTPAV